MTRRRPRRGRLPRARAARLLPLVAGLGLSALFLWLALRETEPAELMEALSGAARWPLLPFGLALGALYWLKAERWRLLIRAEHAPRTARLVDPMMMGFAANNIFPLRAGELVRVYTAGRALGIPKTQVLASLVVERMLDLLSIALLTGTALLVVPLHAASAGIETWLLAAIVPALLVPGIGLLLYGLVGRDLTPLARYAPKRFRGPAEALLGQFAAGLEPIAGRGRLPPILVGSLLQWFLVGLCVDLSMTAVGMEGHSIAVAFIVLGLVVVGISAPSGPAYVGAVEYAFVLGLGFFDVPPATALAAAIYYHGVMFVAITTAGALCWARYATARHRGRTVRPEPPSPDPRRRAAGAAHGHGFAPARAERGGGPPSGTSLGDGPRGRASG